MGVTIQPGARGDTQTLPETPGVVLDNVAALLRDPRSAKHVPARALVDDTHRLLADISRRLVRLQPSIPAIQDRAFSTGC